MKTKKYWILAGTLVFCVLATFCFAQGEKYHNSEKHFSFVLPEGWEFIPKEELSEQELKSIEKNLAPAKGELIGVCQKVGAERFEHSYILVKFANTEGIPEQKIEETLRSNEYRKSQFKYLRELRTGLTKQKKGAKWDDSKADYKVGYDLEKHAFFATMVVPHKSEGDIVVITVRLLGSHRMATLRGGSFGEDSEDFLESVGQIVGSFAYDEGYGFGEAKGIAPGLTQGFLRESMWSWVLWSVGAIIVFWLIRRWVSG